MAAADYNYGAPSSGPATAGYQYNYNDSQFSSQPAQPYSSSYQQPPASTYANYSYDQSYQQTSAPSNYGQASGYEQTQAYDQTSYANPAAPSFTPQDGSYNQAGYEQGGTQGYNPNSFGPSDGYASQSEPIKIVSPGTPGNFANGQSQPPVYNAPDQSAYSAGFGNQGYSQQNNFGPPPGQGPPNDYSNQSAPNYNQAGYAANNYADPQNGFQQNNFNSPPNFNSPNNFGGAPPNTFDGPPPNNFGGSPNGFRGRGGGFRGGRGDRGGFMGGGRGRGGSFNRDGASAQFGGNNGGGPPRYEIQEDTIFISNLPKDVTQDQLREHFSTAGPLKIDSQTGGTKCWVYRDRVTNQGKGEATVTYETAEIANNAVQMYNGQTTLGVKIQVNISKKRLPDGGGVTPSPRGGPRGGPGGAGGGRGGNGMGGGANRASQDDWVCMANGCSNKNFAWRATCNRCQAPRPDGAGGNTSRGGRGSPGGRGGFRGGPPGRGGPGGMRGGFSDRGGGGFRGGPPRGRGGDRGRGGPDRRGGRSDRRDKPY